MIEGKTFIEGDFMPESDRKFFVGYARLAIKPPAHFPGTGEALVEEYLKLLEKVKGTKE